MRSKLFHTLYRKNYLVPQGCIGVKVHFRPRKWIPNPWIRKYIMLSTLLGQSSSDFPICISILGFSYSWKPFPNKESSYLNYGPILENKQHDYSHTYIIMNFNYERFNSQVKMKDNHKEAKLCYSEKKILIHFSMKIIQFVTNKMECYNFL